MVKCLVHWACPVGISNGRTLGTTNAEFDNRYDLSWGESAPVVNGAFTSNSCFELDFLKKFPLCPMLELQRHGDETNTDEFVILRDYLVV